jgi:hypothetical protein
MKARAFKCLMSEEISLSLAENVKKSAAPDLARIHKSVSLEKKSLCLIKKRVPETSALFQ